MRKNIFMVRVECWSTLSREAVESPFMEIFKTSGFLCNLLKGTCFSKRVGFDDLLRSLPTSVILWFCEIANCYTYFEKTSTSLECPFCSAKSNGVAPSSLGSANANIPPGWPTKNSESLTKPNFIARWRRVSLRIGSEKHNKQIK